MLRTYQILCITIFIAVMLALKFALSAIFDWGGEGFPLGVIFGALFTAGLVYVIWLMEPESFASRSARRKNGGFDDGGD